MVIVEIVKMERYLSGLDAPVYFSQLLEISNKFHGSAKF